MRSPWAVALGAAAALAAGSARATEMASEPTVEALRGLSIEELANVQVTTVSRREESLAAAPAATYVITRDDILRSGALTLPDILRLAPNLFVAQTSASTWMITARGLSGNLADQAFSNKLLVLIDGRTVYNPLFSGVFWDLQDLVRDDIERIEVISGPGATLWGANAVNGVINIITRRAGDTTGALVDVGGGDGEAFASLRYGAALGDIGSWRIYGRAYRADNTEDLTGAEINDRWERLQGGFRLDLTPSERDEISLHGDAFKATAEDFESASGGNLTLRWTHAGDDGSSLQTQAYFNREQRGHDITGGAPFWVNTFDLDVQHSFRLGARNEMVWGGGLRSARYFTEAQGGLAFAPARGTLDLANLFAQDTLSLSPNLRVIIGVKLEKDPKTDWTALPSLRLAWTPQPGTMLWAAVSRAIRAPTPLDRDVVESVGSLVFLVGDKDFQAETLTAYEAGLRLQPSARLSLSASAYYNDYDHLRSIEPAPGGFLPIRWGNGIGGHTYGLEAWGNFQAASWWRLSASVNLISEHFSFAPDASGLLGVSQVGDDPKTQAMLKSSMSLGPHVSWDAQLRYQSALPDPRVPAYTELNSRVAWSVTPSLELSVSGKNLLHDRHQEFMAPVAIPRSVLAELRWRY